jgi:CDP-diglyceride synthetase
MLADRVLVTAVMLPVGLAAIHFGGLFYLSVVTIILVLAAYEYVQLFRAGGFRPSGFLVVGGVLLFALGRA